LLNVSTSRALRPVLNLAQSAVSAAIARWKRGMVRNCSTVVGRGVELTEAGALFLVEARAVLARVEAAGLSYRSWAT